MPKPFPFAIAALVGAALFVIACPSMSPLALAFAAGMGGALGASLTLTEE